MSGFIKRFLRRFQVPGGLLALCLFHSWFLYQPRSSKVNRSR
jgi:hypothetical protein